MVIFKNNPAPPIYRCYYGCKQWNDTYNQRWTSLLNCIDYTQYPTCTDKDLDDLSACLFDIRHARFPDLLTPYGTTINFNVTDDNYTVVVYNSDKRIYGFWNGIRTNLTLNDLVF